jgi:Tol biopolymer transport system component
MLVVLTVIGCAPSVTSDTIPEPTLTATIPITNSATTNSPGIQASPAIESPIPAPTEPTHTTPTAISTVGASPPTPPPLNITPIANTLVLYTTGALIQPSPDQPAATYWAFRTLPTLPGLDPTVFETLYGPYEAMEPGRFFFDLRPQLSPNGRYIVVAGLSSYPEYGVEGTGTWLIDLETGAARQLLPDGVIATWNPASDAITYATGDTLYSLDIVEGATPMSLFQSVDLWNLYVKWSPDGRWITAITGVQHEPTGEERTDLTFTYLLIPADGGPARKLAERETYGGGYTAEQASWSPDGQLLLILNRIYDLEGNSLLPDNMEWVEWLPDRSQLLTDSAEGLCIITIAGEEITCINGSAYADEWAFSRNGRRLAYTPRSDAGVSVFIYDMESGETQAVGTVPGANHMNLLRWSADDSRLIASIVLDDGRFGIWSLEAQPSGAIEQLIEDAELIEVVPYPVP